MRLPTTEHAYDILDFHRPVVEFNRRLSRCFGKEYRAYYTKDGSDTVLVRHFRQFGDEQVFVIEHFHTLFPSGVQIEDLRRRWIYTKRASDIHIGSAARKYHEERQREKERFWGDVKHDMKHDGVLTDRKTVHFGGSA